MLKKIKAYFTQLKSKTNDMVEELQKEEVIKDEIDCVFPINLGRASVVERRNLKSTKTH